jgi:hypothetical protein
MHSIGILAMLLLALYWFFYMRKPAVKKECYRTDDFEDDEDYEIAKTQIDNAEFKFYR